MEKTQKRRERDASGQCRFHNIDKLFLPVEFVNSMGCKETILSEAVPGSDHDFEENRNMHSFIVRVWMEVSGTEMDQETWRGHIVHLPDYKRYYFSDLNDVLIFIASQVKGQN